jgi:hypothetical protein
MKNKSIVRLAVIGILFVVVLMGSVQAAFASSLWAPVRLTVINESQYDFSILLYGPEQASLTVHPDQTGIKIVNRGMYSFTMRACNSSKNGKIDLNYEQTIHVPVCGGTAGPLGDKEHHLDASDYIKPVRVTIRNLTGEKIGIYIRTPEKHHFLNFEPGEKQTIILFKEQYVYSYVACGELIVGYYTPQVSPPFDLTCK